MMSNRNFNLKSWKMETRIVVLDQKQHVLFMRIYNLDLDTKVNKVILYLTPDEAQEMKHALEQVISDNKKYHHKHILDNRPLA